ncbi:MAG: UvrD-helicase domain-containing protein [Brevinema sp.]
MTLTDEQNYILELAKSTPRMLITSPPGCGKTTLIIHLLEQLMDKNCVGPYNTVLLMSFSTSAAQKIKLELREKSLSSPKRKQLEYFLKEKTLTTNYHGLCRGILVRYGNKLLENIPHRDSPSILDALKNMGRLSGCDEGEANNLVPPEKKKDIIQKLDAVKNDISPNRKEISDEAIEEYCKIMFEYFLPRKKITYNGIILLVIYLFKKNPILQQSYCSYFSYIIVDEFQDTNILAWQLLSCFLDNSHIKFYSFGDPLQKLYGFIGAVDDIFDKAEKKWGCISHTLTINQRYKNIPALLETTEYIRSLANSEEILPTPPTHKIRKFTSNVDVLKDIQQKFPNHGTYTLLFSDRFSGHKEIIDLLKAYNIPYFFAMFKDTEDYSDFHTTALELWGKYDIENNVIQNLKFLIRDMQKKITTQNWETYQSLLILLELVVEQFKKGGSFGFLDSFDQFQIIEDILHNDGLKQFIDKIQGKVVLSTIHAAKGQQWDFTTILFSDQTLKGWKKIDTLSTIYVAISRASKETSILYTSDREHELIDAIT